MPCTFGKTGACRVSTDRAATGWKPRSPERRPFHRRGHGGPGNADSLPRSERVTWRPAPRLSGAFLTGPGAAFRPQCSVCEMGFTRVPAQSLRSGWQLLCADPIYIALCDLASRELCHSLILASFLKTMKKKFLC